VLIFDQFLTKMTIKNAVCDGARVYCRLLVRRGRGKLEFSSEGSSEKLGSDQEVIWQRFLSLMSVLDFTIASKS